jgi:hypothetical protein
MSSYTRVLGFQGEGPTAGGDLGRCGAHPWLLALQEAAPWGSSVRRPSHPHQVTPAREKEKENRIVALTSGTRVSWTQTAVWWREAG